MNLYFIKYLQIIYNEFVINTIKMNVKIIYSYAFNVSIPIGIDRGVLKLPS